MGTKNLFTGSHPRGGGALISDFLNSDVCQIR